jgi:hypothetical protein
VHLAHLEHEVHLVQVVHLEHEVHLVQVVHLEHEAQVEFRERAASEEAVEWVGQ